MARPKVDQLRAWLEAGEISAEDGFRVFADYYALKLEALELEVGADYPRPFYEGKDRAPDTFPRPVHDDLGIARGEFNLIIDIKNMMGEIGMRVADKHGFWVWPRALADMFGFHDKAGAHRGWEVTNLLRSLKAAKRIQQVDDKTKQPYRLVHTA